MKEKTTNILILANKYIEEHYPDKMNWLEFYRCWKNGIDVRKSAVTNFARYIEERFDSTYPLPTDFNKISKIKETL